MKTFETTTNIVLVMSPGTYWGVFEYDRLWRPYEEDERENGNIVCNDYSFAKFKEAMVREANEVLKDSGYLKEYGVASVKVTAMGSPKYYNFGDDWFDLEFNVEDGFLDRAEKAIFDPKYRDMLSKYAEDSWRSHDGFTSDMLAWSLEEMHDVFEMLRKDDCGRDDMRAFGSVIALLREIEKREGRMSREDDYEEDSLTMQLKRRIIENYSLSEFCTVMSLDEAKDRYGSFREILKEVEEQRKSISEQVEKYCKCNVSNIGKAHATDIKERVFRELGAFINDAVKEVEWNYPDPGRIDDGVESVREKLHARMEESWRQPPAGAADNNEENQ